MSNTAVRSATLAEEEERDDEDRVPIIRQLSLLESEISNGNEIIKKGDVVSCYDTAINQPVG